MSGIVGVFYPTGQPVEREAAQRMLATITHRGPDESRLWLADNVALGHCMLWTTPESLHERLPLANSTGDIVLTADARIDNRDELISLLGLGAGPTETLGDGDILLAAYERWGEACPEKLLGDFAFAIWDARRQALFCARDQFGVKSLYYFASGAAVAVGTEIKAILAVAEVPRALNETRIADCLGGTLEDQAGTFYRGIERLPAAHSLTVDAAGARRRRYWALDPTRELRLSSPDEYAEAFRELFFAAVRCRLRSAFPVGATLSGGLDSSSIACTARTLLSAHDQQLHTYSAIFPSLPAHELSMIDERLFIEAVLSAGGYAPRFVHADRLSPLEEYDKVFWHMDEAFVAPNLYMHWGLYGAAQQDGVRVFLDGIDGDTTVSHGLEFLTELAGSGRWRRLAREARALSRVSYPSNTPRRIIWHFGVQPLIERWGEQLWPRTRHERARASILNQAFARRIGFAHRLRMLERQSAPRGYSARAAHYSNLRSGLLPYMLELADKAAAAFTLEPRYPFCDRRLVEFCLAVPPEQKLRQGWTRAILRRAMGGVLPPQIQGRIGKAMLGPNFYRNFIAREQPVIEAMILDNAAILEDYVHLPTLRAAYTRHLQHPAEQPPALTVYTATLLALWLQKTGLHPAANVDHV